MMVIVMAIMVMMVVVLLRITVIVIEVWHQVLLGRFSAM